MGMGSVSTRYLVDGNITSMGLPMRTSYRYDWVVQGHPGRAVVAH
jgi:hypothetical protein